MQEIIVYRNPVEAAFWHSMFNGGAGAFLIFAGVMLVSFLAIYFGLTTLTGKGKWNGDGGDWIIGFSLFLSGVLACFAVYKFA